MLTARSDFNLQTRTAVCGFIAAGGLERPAYINTTTWEKNPNPSTTVMIDAYNFFSGSLYGYLAFACMPTGLWMIKSLKRNNNTDPRAFLLADKLRKAGLVH